MLCVDAFSACMGRHRSLGGAARRYAVIRECPNSPEAMAAYQQSYYGPWLHAGMQTNNETLCRHWLDRRGPGFLISFWEKKAVALPSTLYKSSLCCSVACCERPQLRHAASSTMRCESPGCQFSRCWLNFCQGLRRASFPTGPYSEKNQKPTKEGWEWDCSQCPEVGSDVGQQQGLQSSNRDQSPLLTLSISSQRHFVFGAASKEGREE